MTEAMFFIFSFIISNAIFPQRAQQTILTLLALFGKSADLGVSSACVGSTLVRCSCTLANLNWEEEHLQFLNAQK